MTAAEQQLVVPVAQSPADAIASKYPLHLVVLGILFYATGPVLARSAETSGLLLSFWRLWFGVAAFAVALAAHKLSGRPLGSVRGVKLAMFAGAAFSLNQICFFTAVKRTSVVDVSLLGTLSPVMIALLAVPLFGERPGRQFRWWSLLGVAGAAYVVLGSSQRPEGDLVGMLLALAATAAFALFFVASKMARDDVPVVVFLTVAMATSAVCVSVVVLVLNFEPGTVGSGDLRRALAIGLIPGALGHVAMTWPLRYLPANVPPLFRLSTPLVAGVLAWIFLGEGVAWVHVIGGVVIVVSLAGAIMSKGGQQLVADARAKVLNPPEAADA